MHLFGLTLFEMVTGAPSGGYRSPPPAGITESAQDNGTQLPPSLVHGVFAAFDKTFGLC